jgi:hypothetical protein
MTNLPAIRIEDLPEEFFIDLAVGTNSYVEICDNYGIDESTSVVLESDPLFQRRLRIAQQVVEDDGTAFRSRCRVAVANSVHHVVHMMQDTDVPASTQLDAFKTLVKYGGLEPQKEDNSGVSGPQLVLNIVAPDGTTTDFVAKMPQKTSQNTIEDADFEEIDTPELSILPPQASTLFGAS